MRASRAPEKWQLVLNAINRDDYELANKLAVKYNFASKVKEETVYDDVRHTPLKGDYVAQSPDGKIHCHEFAGALSRYLGLSHSYIGGAVIRLEKHGGYSRSGNMKGWTFWKEE